jgi:hypothetical protein
MAVPVLYHSAYFKPGSGSTTSYIVVLFFSLFSELRWYHTLQGDNSLKSVARFDRMMFLCRFQASR